MEVTSTLLIEDTIESDARRKKPLRSDVHCTLYNQHKRGMKQLRICTDVSGHPVELALPVTDINVLLLSV